MNTTPWYKPCWRIEPIRNPPFGHPAGSLSNVIAFLGSASALSLVPCLTCVSWSSRVLKVFKQGFPTVATLQKHLCSPAVIPLATCYYHGNMSDRRSFWAVANPLRMPLYASPAIADVIFLSKYLQRLNGLWSSTSGMTASVSATLFSRRVFLSWAPLHQARSTQVSRALS